MSNRDWDKELAEIDRRLATAPDERTATPAAGGAPLAPAPPGGAPPLARRAAAPVATQGTVPARAWRAHLALLLRVAIGGAIVAALFYWPYPASCGTGLGYYLAVVALLALAGLATSIAAWRHRAPFVHVLGLAMLLAAGGLGARELLPKLGYAYPSPEHPVSWSCG